MSYQYIYEFPCPCWMACLLVNFFGGHLSYCYFGSQLQMNPHETKGILGGKFSETMTRVPSNSNMSSQYNHYPSFLSISCMYKIESHKEENNDIIKHYDVVSLYQLFTEPYCIIQIHLH